MRLPRVSAGIALALLCDVAAHSAAPVPLGLDAEARAQGTVRTIVLLAPPVARADLRRRQDDALSHVGSRARGRARRYANLALLALEATPSDLSALAAAPEVIGLEADRLAAPSLDTTGPLIGATSTAAAGFDGSGAAVAIIDTGVDRAHPFLAGRVVSEACFSSGGDCPGGGTTEFGAGSGVPCSFSGACFHGTHVAGIAAGANATYQGVAPGAQIVAIRVFTKFTGAICAGAGYDPCALAWTSDIIAGLDHARSLAGALPLVAANLSLGSGQFFGKSGCDSSNVAEKIAIDALLGVGVATVAASGNDGWSDSMNAPACISSAVAVGATTDTDAVASFSNSAYMLDLFAPGVTVRSASPGGGTVYATGTSMATPQVTGALAVLRQADTSATIATLLDALETTGPLITDPRPAQTLQRARIQVDTAVKSRAPTACYDGFDNDADGKVDYPADDGCASGLGTSEVLVASNCGIGPELALVLPLLALARRRSRAGRV